METQNSSSELPAEAGGPPASAGSAIPAAVIDASLALCLSDIDGEDFDSMVALYGKEDEQREVIIKKSRDILKLSKQAIFALHRRDVEQARRNLTQCQSFIAEVLPITEEFPVLRFVGIFVGALEEMAEAQIFLSFLTEHRLPRFESLHPLRVEEYLGGLMDFTGELNRYAVLRATEQDLASVSLCKDFVNRIHEKMLLLDLRNSPLRRKYDTLKYTEKKLEALCYELKMGEILQGMFLASARMEPEPIVTKGEQEEGEEKK
ncbi:translin family protein [Besnoitia besnoiti]|uniref:Translin family protein n=1 Tax=Besnoitia besnoiti TaxID=94643 RepID=A0A2A9M9E4_BESBE|nr:translin family protein [Besnoitia besnoiti]PFH35098.1 translin family protein [Besnoitia besnoiti]